MATAVFSQGMESYNNTEFSPFTAQYTSWKGTGAYSYPVAITAGNIRPLTNNDPSNSAMQKPGLPRPLKWQYRKGTTQKTVTVIDPKNPNQYIQVNRESNTSKTSSLIGQLIDRPGQFSVKHNPSDEINESLQLNTDCNTCHGIGLVTSFSPEPFLTNNPQPCVTNPGLCCNQEQKALKMVLPANTNLPKNYFTTLQQYRQNRCQTYDQRIFNFKTDIHDSVEYADLLKRNGVTAEQMKNSKPGDPLSLLNLYVANCYPNTDASLYSQYGIVQQLTQILTKEQVLTSTDIIHLSEQNIINIPQLNAFLTTIEGDSAKAHTILMNFINNPYIGIPPSGPSNSRNCKLVVYKPSNPQFAVQGGVSSSTRLLKLTVDTIGSNLASMRKLKGSGSGLSSNPGQQPDTPFIYKTKVQTPISCNKTSSGNNMFWHGQKSFVRNCAPKTAEYYRTKALSKLGNIGGNVNGTFVGDPGMTGSNH